MQATQTYYELVLKCLERIRSDEKNNEKLEKAANWIAEATMRGELIYIVGTGGHSNMIAEECMCRAGVLANIDPMIDVTNLFNGTVKSRMLQRNPAYASGVLDQYYIPEGSVLIINNAYGINALTIEIAEEAKRRGLRTIGIASSQHFNNTPLNHAGRHPSNKTLFDVVDIGVDNFMPHGDAIIEIPGVEQPVGPVSTILGVFVLQNMLIRAVEIAAEKGANPDIWRSINLPGGDAYDERLFREYGKRIKYLL